MARMKRELWLAGACALVAIFGISVASAQPTETRFFAKPPQSDAAPRAPHPPGVLKCRGPITQVSDVAFEGVLVTPFSFPVAGGGGDGGCFDPTPVLTTTVNLADGTCLDAHLSAIVGNSQTYGVAPLAMFQVSLTNLLAVTPPQHMIGHYETPYGFYCPAVAIEAERDVDTFGSNFFQSVGNQPGDVPPGFYRVDVWWAGAPPFVAPGGAIGAAFVLKLYQR